MCFGIPFDSCVPPTEKQNHPSFISLSPSFSRLFFCSCETAWLSEICGHHSCPHRAVMGREGQCSSLPQLWSGQSVWHRETQGKIILGTERERSKERYSTMHFHESLRKKKQKLGLIQLVRDWICIHENSHNVPQCCLPELFGLEDKKLLANSLIIFYFTSCILIS